MLPMTTLAHGYIHWAASKGERQYPKSPQRRCVQPQYLFCPQIKSEKGTPTITLVPIGKTHTHTHSTHTDTHTKHASCPQLLSCVQLFVTPWTVPTRVLCPWDSPGKNTGVGCHALLQGIFPIQESNLHLLHLLALAGGFFFFFFYD